MGKSKPVRPTRDQKELISGAGLIWRNWLVSSETPEVLHIVSKASGKSRTIEKPLQGGHPSQRHK